MASPVQQEEPSHQATNLLSLPREVRDLIYDELFEDIYFDDVWPLFQLCFRIRDEAVENYTSRDIVMFYERDFDNFNIWLRCLRRSNRESWKETVSRIKSFTFERYNAVPGEKIATSLKNLTNVKKITLKLDVYDFTEEVDQDKKSGRVIRIATETKWTEFFRGLRHISTIPHLEEVVIQTTNDVEPDAFYPSGYDYTHSIAVEACTYLRYRNRNRSDDPMRVEIRAIKLDEGTEKMAKKTDSEYLADSYVLIMNGHVLEIL